MYKTVGTTRIFPFSSHWTAYDSFTYDPVKARLSELHTEEEEQISHNANSQTVQVQIILLLSFAFVQFLLFLKLRNKRLTAEM